MLIPPNVIPATAGNAAGSTAKNAENKTRADNGAGNQDFGSLLSVKVNDAQQKQSTAAQNTVSGDGDDMPANASARPAVDETAACPNPPAEDVSDTAAPSGAGKGGVKIPLFPANDPDPSLSAGAVQALMALLAQTRTAAPAASTPGATALGNNTSANPDLADAAIGAGDNTRPDAGDNIADAAVSTAAPIDIGADNAQTEVLPLANPAAGADSIPASLILAGNDKILAAPAPAGGEKSAKPSVPAGSDRHLKASPLADADNHAPAAAQGAAIAMQSANGGHSDAGATANGAVGLRKPAAAMDAATPAATPVAVPTLSAAGDGVAATPTPAAALISAQLGSDEWQQAIGQQVVMFSRNGQQSAELRLHPDTLGALHISLQVDNNQAQIHLASGHSQVRAALEAALPHLRTALAESGINLGQSCVGSDATPNWGGGDRAPSSRSQGQRAFSIADAAAADPAGIPLPVATARSLSGIDTFV
ncbi:flagellar hook-length control protein FliK [Sodalis sp. RH21]|uniref:flagellar hook-length control protein FliK n=1 Tax=unclassified Sodalis (in: enterobacteria) TaxID=2636512 RepID=UPI0039B3CAAE